MRAPEKLWRDGQPKKTDEQQEQMERGLVFRHQAASRRIRIEIAEEKRGLKKDETSGPNGRRASKPGKNQFGEERFN